MLKHMKRSSSLIFTEMQSKTTMAVIIPNWSDSPSSKNSITVNAGVSVRKRGNVNWNRHCGAQHPDSLRKMKLEQRHDTAISFLGLYVEKTLN